MRVATARGVTTLTLDRPHNRNALSTPRRTELLAGRAAAVADDAVRAVPPGRLEVIANYTAFQDIRAELDRVN